MEGEKMRERGKYGPFLSSTSCVNAIAKGPSSLFHQQTYQIAQFKQKFLDFLPFFLYYRSINMEGERGFFFSITRYLDQFARTSTIPEP